MTKAAATRLLDDIEDALAQAKDGDVPAAGQLLARSADHLRATLKQEKSPEDKVKKDWLDKLSITISMVAVVIAAVMSYLNYQQQKAAGKQSDKLADSAFKLSQQRNDWEEKIQKAASDIQKANYNLAQSNAYKTHLLNEKTLQMSAIEKIHNLAGKCEGYKYAYLLTEVLEFEQLDKFLSNNDIAKIESSCEEVMMMVNEGVEESAISHEAAGTAKVPVLAKSALQLSKNQITVADSGWIYLGQRRNCLLYTSPSPRDA